MRGTRHDRKRRRMVALSLCVKSNKWIQESIDWPKDKKSSDSILIEMPDIFFLL